MRSRKIRLRDSKLIAIVEQFANGRESRGHALGEILRQVMLDAADAHVGHGQARAGEILDDPGNQLARFDHVKSHRDRAQLRSGHAAAG